MAQHAPPSASAIPGGDALAQVMQQYVQTQQAELDKGRKKGTLSYDLKARVKEVGLSGLPDLPTEDAMIRLESASKAAHAQGRQYVGSAEARISNRSCSVVRSLQATYVRVTAASPFNSFFTRFRATVLAHTRSEQR